MAVALPASVSAAPRFMLGLEAGVCKPAASSFRDDLCQGLFAGLRFNPLDVQVSATKLGSFSNDDYSSTNIGITTLSLLAVPHFRVARRWTLDLVGGVSAWHAKAKVLGQDIGTDDGQSLTIGAGGTWNLKPFLDLQLRLQHYRDVSGADINGAMFGVNFIIGREANP